MIPADSFLLDGDTALVVASDPRNVWGKDELFDRPCDICKGLGRDIADLVTPCSDCDGTGRHTFMVYVSGDTDRPSLWVHVIDVTQRGDGQWLVRLKVHQW